MSELGQDLGGANPLFEHLRWSFDKIGFHADAADAGPLLLSAENVVHEVAEFVEERLHVAIVHQARVVGGGRGEVADEYGFRQLLPAESIEHRRPFRLARFAWA